MFQVAAGKMVTPLIGSAWQRDGYLPIDGNGNPQVAAGAYTPTHRTLLPCTSGGVLLRYDVLLGGGVTSCATRVVASEYLSGVAAQTIHEDSGITVARNVFTTVPIPDAILSPAASPIGRLVQLDIEVRVTGGAGNVVTVPILPPVNQET